MPKGRSGLPDIQTKRPFCFHSIILSDFCWQADLTPTNQSLVTDVLPESQSKTLGQTIQ